MWRFILFTVYLLISSCSTESLPVPSSTTSLDGYYVPISTCLPGCCCLGGPVMILKHSNSYELLTTLITSNGTGCSIPTPYTNSTLISLNPPVPTPIIMGNMTWDMSWDMTSTIMNVGIRNKVGRCGMTYQKQGNMNGNMCNDDDMTCQVCVSWSNYHHSQQGSCDPTTWKRTTCSCDTDTCSCSNTYVASFYALICTLLLFFSTLISTIILCRYFTWCPLHSHITRFLSSCYNTCCCCCQPANRVADWFKYHVLRKTNDTQNEHSEELMMEHERHRDSDGRELIRHDNNEEFKHGHKIVREEHKTEYQKWKEKQDMEDDIAYQELFA